MEESNNYDVSEIDEVYRGIWTGKYEGMSSEFEKDLKEAYARVYLLTERQVEVLYNHAIAERRDGDLEEKRYYLTTLIKIYIKLRYEVIKED